MTNFNGKIPQQTNRDAALYTSPLGTPVQQDITFPAGTYMQDDGTAVTVAEVKLITVLINVSQSKKIVTTAIQGRPGTIKEFVGGDDYQITINGIITGSNGRYPAEEVRALKSMLDVAAPLPIICRYLQALDIYHVVVKDYTLDQEPGGYSQKNFTINCVSDALAIAYIS